MKLVVLLYPTNPSIATGPACYFLFESIILSLVATVNISNDPHLVLISIVVVIGAIFFLKAVIEGRLYKNRLVDIVETVFYINVLAFATLTWYKVDN